MRKHKKNGTYETYVSLREKGLDHDKVRDQLKTQGIEGRVLHGWRQVYDGYLGRKAPFTTEAYAALREGHDFQATKQMLLKKGLSANRIAGFESQYSRHTALPARTIEEYVRDKRAVLSYMHIYAKTLEANPDIKAEFKKRMERRGWEDYQMRGCEGALNRGSA